MVRATRGGSPQPFYRRGPARIADAHTAASGACWVAEGAANKTIAWKLGISEHTVKFHVASILTKLNAASRTEAVAIGIRRGLVLL
jgi:hypothetical protein